MRDKLIPLARICPQWRGSRIPTAFAALQLGIARENERHFGHRLITVKRAVVLEEDGLSFSLAILDGFDQEDDAVNSINIESQITLKEALDEPCYGDYKWHQEETCRPYYPRFHGPHIESLNVIFFEVVTGSRFDEKSWQYEVLRVDADPIVGSDLFLSFTVYSPHLQDHYAEEQWAHYLIGCGEAS